MLQPHPLRCPRARQPRRSAPFVSPAVSFVLLTVSFFRSPPILALVEPSLNVGQLIPDDGLRYLDKSRAASALPPPFRQDAFGNAQHLRLFVLVYDSAA